MSIPSIVSRTREDHGRIMDCKRCFTQGDLSVALAHCRARRSRLPVHMRILISSPFAIILTFPEFAVALTGT